MSESLISELSSAEEYEIPIIKKANIIIEYNFLIFSINNIIEKIIEENKKNLKSYKKNVKQQSKMFFSSNEKPEIKLYDYLKRIYKYLHPEDSTLIISLILIDRFCCEAKLILTEYNTFNQNFINWKEKITNSKYIEYPIVTVLLPTSDDTN